MAASLPYLASNKNVGTLFEKIKSAKLPDKFTHGFLTTTIGLKGTNDRQLIPLLRNMGFLDQSGTPLPDYSLLKGPNYRAAIADGVRRAYGPLFDANQEADKLTGNELKGLIGQVAGVDADAAARIASTFQALVKTADFDKSAPDVTKTTTFETESDDDQQPSAMAKSPSGLRTEFHYNIQVHLPANANEETYLNRFNAIRKTFQ